MVTIMYHMLQPVTACYASAFCMILRRNSNLSLNNITTLIFEMMKCSPFFQERTEFVNII